MLSYMLSLVHFSGEKEGSASETKGINWRRPPARRRANRKWESEFTLFLAAGPFKSALLQVDVGHFNSTGKPQRADESYNI